VGLVRIEVVIIAVVGVDILIQVDSASSPSGTIDTVFVSLVCMPIVACRNGAYHL
jgi:hypothetical protein